MVFRYCGYILACALGVRYYSYSHYSQYAGLLSTRNILAASTPILSVLGLRFFLEHLFVKPLYCLEHQEPHLSCGDIYCICCILLSQSQNIMAQPRPQATFLNLRLRRIHWTCRARYLFRINIHLPIPYLYDIIVVMIPQLFRKQDSLSSKVCVCVLHDSNGWIKLLLLNRCRIS